MVATAVNVPPASLVVEVRHLEVSTQTILLVCVAAVARVGQLYSCVDEIRNVVCFFVFFSEMMLVVAGVDRCRWNCCHCDFRRRRLWH